MRGSPEQRFWAKVDKTPTCWLWQGQPTRRGYGHLWVDGGHRRVHRYAYELLVGPIPDGLTIDHLCRVKTCVNPEHLEVVTRRENIHRYIGMSETHCVRGHEFTPETTHYETYGGYERRRCRMCRREDHLKRRAAASCMTTLVTPAEMEQIAWDHPCSTIQSEYAGDVEIRRHLAVGRTHYVANVVRREVTLAEAMRAVRP